MRLIRPYFSQLVLVAGLMGWSSAIQAKDVRQLYQESCAACHGDVGMGNRDFGAPNLTDAIWLYGGDRDTIRETISYSRGGVMPAWGQILDAATVKQLAVYVHSLGGGQ